MGEVVAKQFSALGQEVTAFFFFLSEQFIMLWSLATEDILLTEYLSLLRY